MFLSIYFSHLRQVMKNVHFQNQKTLKSNLWAVRSCFKKIISTRGNFPCICLPVKLVTAISAMLLISMTVTHPVTTNQQSAHWPCIFDLLNINMSLSSQKWERKRNYKTPSVRFLSLPVHGHWPGTDIIFENYGSLGNSQIINVSTFNYSPFGRVMSGR